MPLSIVATYAFMFAAGFSLDNLSLMALILVVGFVVDDAIVMLENIVRHREMGKSAWQAAMDGAGEVGFTIMSMTISLAAVFIPLLFMPGVAGRMFVEFAAVIIIAVSVSLFIAISLTPMLSARFLSDASVQPKNGWFKRTMESGFDKLLHGYEASLHFVMRHRFATFVASLALIAATAVLAAHMPTGFFPAMDGGRIRITTRAEESISFAALAEAQRSLHPIIAADPAVQSYLSTVGGGTRGETNSGNITVRLKPIKEREHIDVVINRLRAALGNNPTLNVYVQNADSRGAGGTGGQYTYTLVGTDVEELYPAAQELERALKDVASVRDVGTDLQLMNPTILLQIDRDKAGMLDITLRQIENALYSAFGTRQISTIYTDVSDYTVKLEVLPELQDSASVLSAIYLRSGKGALVPLDTIVTYKNEAGPLTVNHRGQFPAVNVSFNISPGYAMGDAMQDVEDTAAEILPDSVTGSFTGTAQDFQSSVVSMVMLIIVALTLIYIVLGILYESFIHPITILSGLPSAAFGAMLLLWLFDLELDMMAFVGIIMLIGIVKKNAIMMIDFALAAEREQGMSPREAIYQACLLRFRPILMTTLAALLGALPLMLSTGVGAELRRPLGIGMVGGLIVSQVLTLFTTPVIYLLFDRLALWTKSRFARHEEEA